MLVQKSSWQALLILLTATLTVAGCNMGATPAPTIDVNAINTAAFATAMGQISAQQTQTALAAPPAALPTNTPLSLTAFALPSDGAASPAGGVLPTVSFNTTPNTTPLAGFTPLATSLPATSSIRPTTASGCNDGVLVGETLPDKSEVEAGEYFQKAWTMKNIGTCDWDEGYVFAFQEGLSDTAIKGYDIVMNGSDRLIKPNREESFVLKLLAPTTPGEYKGYWRMKDDAGNLFGSLVFFYVVVK